jgi:hypothetical protein
MMYSPIRRSGAARALATPKVVKAFVNQPVHLRPQGNTIALSVPAEMPFLTRGITVVTQASGGMAKADTRNTSKRIRWGEQNRGVSGLGGELEDKAYSLFNQYDKDAASMDRGTFDASGAKRAYWEGEAKKQMPAAGPSAWSKAGDIFATTASTGLNVFSQINSAKIAASNAAAAQAQADIAKTASAAGWARATDVSQYGAGMAARKSITIPLLVIGGGALAVALFLFLRKKSAGSAPAAA